jgi:SAM-dependent methyltransferase
MKLNLGCGHHKRSGFLNVDVRQECLPDVTLDLEKTPWPWESNSADAVVFVHSLEHMGGDPRVFREMMRELYRICRNGAEVFIQVPHPRHDDFITDPTHVRAITPATLLHLSRRNNMEWIKSGAANTPLAIYWEVDFEIKKINYRLDEPYLSQLAKGELSPEQVEQLSRERNNVIKEIGILLIANK